MAIPHLLAFTVAAFVLIVIPGPSVLFIVSRALTVGRRGALLTVLGNGIGEYVQVIAVSFGVAAVVERSAAVFTALKLCGAAYVVFLGVEAIRHRRSLAAALVVPKAPSGVSRVMADGFLVGVTNPKSLVFFAAILPQFADPAAGRLTPQLLVLGAVFLVIALLSDATWALLAGTARNWFARSPRRLAAIGGAGGVAMIGIGVTVALTGRRD